MRHRRSAATTAVLALAACASGAQNFQSALASCSANPSGHTEVYIPEAFVERVLGEREGRSGIHEGFLIAVGSNDTLHPVRLYKVEDNVNITGPIPLHRGDTISLLGQLECDDYVIHWTHRDPRGRHPSGYIKVNGKLYD